MLKIPFGPIALCVLAVLLMSCAPVHRAAQPSAPAAAMRPAAFAAGPNGPLNAPVNQNSRDRSSSNSDGVFRAAESPIGLDYAPETRCSDNDPSWLPGQRPVACDPPLGQQTCGDGLNACPTRCQKCYADDLAFMQRDLRVNTITIYQPNYYILKAAHALGMKVVVGLLNEAVLGLAAPASQTACSDAGSALYLCGPNYASALIDGACIDTAGGDPFASCVSHCAQRSNPARDCAHGDCSCDSDADCPGASNQCRRGAYLAPLNNPSTGEFLRDGTVAGIQLGNEFFKACEIAQIPGQNQPCCTHNRKTGKCTSWYINRQVFSTAAQTLRRALDSRGLNQIKISVALVEEQGREFCQNGAPPPGVDYIAAHPYCDFVAEVPARWSTLSGKECWQQAANKELAIDQSACGAARTYIGETGFNSGNPATPNKGVLLAAERDFVQAMLQDEPACKGQSNPAAPFPNFLFEYGDVCPPGGCLAGGADPLSCNSKCCCHHQCSDHAVCSAGCPACTGNGYFGLYRTPGYATAGFPPEPKFDPMPSLLCPASQK